MPAIVNSKIINRCGRASAREGSLRIEALTEDKLALTWRAGEPLELESQPRRDTDRSGPQRLRLRGANRGPLLFGVRVTSLE